jgi:predicted lipoprotein with Yx(FWY)xxD motif
VIKVTSNKTWGSILTLGNGTTVYRLTADRTDKSVCSAACAKIWPPVLLASGQKSPNGHGVKHLGEISRSGGDQVTYEGVPLYTYVGDHGAGQVTGNFKDSFGQWWVVNPKSPLSVPKTASTTSTGASGSGVAY